MERQTDDAFYAATGEAARHGAIIDEKKALSTTDSHDLDVDNGYIYPTDEEMKSLRHVSDTINWNTYLIAFVELAERFSFYGSTIVFTNFIQQPLPPGSHTGSSGAHGQPGALDQGQRASFGLTTFFNFWCYVTPLYGAYLADAKFGRFNTICGSVFVALVGHVILIVSALPPVLEHQKGALGCLVIAMIVMGLGTGGFKSNISPLVAEQQKLLRPYVIQTRKGERVIVDPSMTTSRIYMYFYFFINVGALVGQVAMTFAEKRPFAPTLPCSTLVSGCPSLSPRSSSFSALSCLWLDAICTTALLRKAPFCQKQTFKNLTAADFWDDVKPSKVAEVDRPRWMTFDDQWVDEVRRGFKACTVFLWYPIYWLTYNQMVNNLTSQAAVMVTNGVPNDVINNLDPFALLIFIPICDIFLYPFLRRIGIRVTPIRKITAGFFTGAAAMIWAAVTQHYIYKRNPCGYSVSTCVDAGGNAITSDLNVWIQTGAYVLIAFSEILASITGLEYAFTKAPANMKSLVMAVFLFTSAVANALGEAFTALSSDPLLVWNYGVMAVIAAVGGVFFWFMFRHLDDVEEELNNLQEGHLEK
ncbi:hypothetical protein EW146_g9207 [Bondarzewia mesenterica]|uniref:Major facilitator superfamily (MFS) profile domain-containing protein n=1 Tax=Bondarzewia mesenterica TaxID=1095465 RepID=A0A4S4LDN6_9AGAM|nr:hypothetical protein EW146_g9207 [Bondarzewia mesenterica]